MFTFSGKQPANLGAKNGKLAPVIHKPNNVSSQADINDRAHYVAPFKFTGDAAAAFQKLVRLVQTQPRAKTLTDSEIEAVSGKIVGAVAKATGAKLRT